MIMISQMTANSHNQFCVQCVTVFRFSY